MLVDPALFLIPTHRPVLPMQLGHGLFQLLNSRWSLGATHSDVFVTICITVSSDSLSAGIEQFE